MNLTPIQVAADKSVQIYNFFQSVKKRYIRFFYWIINAFMWAKKKIIRWNQPQPRPVNRPLSSTPHIIVEGVAVLAAQVAYRSRAGSQVSVNAALWAAPKTEESFVKVLFFFLQNIGPWNSKMSYKNLYLSISFFYTLPSVRNYIDKKIKYFFE